MQHNSQSMGSQNGMPQKGFSSSMPMFLKAIDKSFTVTLPDVRLNLLTLVLISRHRGAA